MIHRKLSAGFEKWQTDAAEMKAQEAALMRALMKMVHTKLSGALMTWRMTASETAGSYILKEITTGKYDAF